MREFAVVHNPSHPQPPTQVQINVAVHQPNSYN